MRKINEAGKRIGLAQSYAHENQNERRNHFVMKNFVKITEDIVEKTYKEHKNLPLCETVTAHIKNNTFDFCCCIDECLINCESPIEQLLSIEMISNGLYLFDIFTNDEIDVITIKNQEVIETANRNYRVDFLIPVQYSTKKTSYYKQFIIECDGHDYHEKTKKQVAYNNQRERDLKSAGYEVIRFSGSEIYKSPYNCVKEIAKIIYSKMERR